MSLLQQSVATLIGLSFFIFWAWMFSDMLKNDEIPPNLRTQWIVAFIFINMFAAILYYINVYRNK